MRCEFAAFAAIAAGLLIFGRGQMLRDPGTFWHGVVGERILETRSLPHVDELTWSHAGQAWIAQQWLGECAMAALHRIGGLDALLLAAVVLLAGTYAAGFGRLVRVRVAWPAAAMVVALVIAGSSYHFLVRPHLVTIALSGWLFGMLCDVDAGRVSRLKAWWLPVVFALWTNLHGGAAGGIATVGLAVIGWIAWPLRIGDCGVRIEDGEEAFAVRRGFPRRGVRMLLGNAMFLAVCAGAVLVNPYGVELPRTWAGLMRSNVLPRMIQEHAPPSLGAMETWMLAGLAAMYLGVIAGADRRRVRAVHLLPLVWAALAATRIRHGPIFAVMAPIGMAELLPGSRIAGWLRERGSDLIETAVREDEWGSVPIRRTRWGLRHVSGAVLGLGLVLQSAGVRVPLVGAGWARLDEGYWPVKVLPQLRSAVGTGANVFNETLFGGFVEYFVPAARTYIDDRCELMGDDGLLEYAELARRPEGLEKVLEEGDVRMALVSRGSVFERWFGRQARWRCVGADGVAAVYQLSSSRDTSRWNASGHLRSGRPDRS